MRQLLTHRRAWALAGCALTLCAGTLIGVSTYLRGTHQAHATGTVARLVECNTALSPDYTTSPVAASDPLWNRVITASAAEAVVKHGPGDSMTATLVYWSKPNMNVPASAAQDNPNVPFTGPAVNIPAWEIVITYAHPSLMPVFGPDGPPTTLDPATCTVGHGVDFVDALNARGIEGFSYA